MASDIEKEFFGYDANGKPIEGEFRRSPFYTNPRIVALAMRFTGWLAKDRFHEKIDCPSGVRKVSDLVANLLCILEWVRKDPVFGGGAFLRKAES